MRALLGSTALVCLLATSACGMAVKYPEFGGAAYRLEGTATPPEGGAPVSTVIYRDGAKMRVETILPGRGPATIVFDDATKAAYIITAAAVPAAAPVPQPAPGTTTSSTTTTTSTAAPEAGAPATIAPTPPVATPAPATQTAVGVAVRINDEDAPTPLEDAWAALGEKGAKSAGSCTVAGEKGRAWTPRKQETAGVLRVACITEDGIVLQIHEGNAVLWQTSKLDRGPQAATLFGIPAGYSIVDPQAVAETVGDTMNKLGSVAGEAKTPVTAQKPPG